MGEIWEEQGGTKTSWSRSFATLFLYKIPLNTGWIGVCLYSFYLCFITLVRSYIDTVASLAWEGSATLSRTFRCVSRNLDGRPAHYCLGPSKNTMLCLGVRCQQQPVHGILCLLQFQTETTVGASAAAGLDIIWWIPLQQMKTARNVVFFKKRSGDVFWRNDCEGWRRAIKRPYLYTTPLSLFFFFIPISPDRDPCVAIAST